MLRFYFLACLLCSCFAASAQFGRLSARAFYHPDTYKLQDSTQYVYNNRYNVNYDSLLQMGFFDTLYVYTGDGVLTSIGYHQVNAEGRLMSYQSDHLINNIWHKNFYNTRYERNENGQLSYEYTRYNPRDSNAQGYSYNDKGQVVQKTLNRWSVANGKWQAEYMYRYGYNAHDSIAITYYITVRDGVIEDTSSRTTVTYAAGKKEELTEGNGGAAGWYAGEKSITLYNEDNQPTRQEWWWKHEIGGDWYPRNRTYYYYNARQFTDSIIEQVFTANAYKDQYRTYYTYDYFYQTITTHKYMLNWQSNSYYHAVFMRDYYEDIPPLPDSVGVNLTFNIYPIPTSGILYADVTGSTATNATLRICNALGQVATVLQLPTLPVKRMPVPIPQLAAGLYTATLYADGITLTKKWMVQ